MDSKQRKIRSLRGFFLYALEIMKKREDYEILSTNLQPFFWRKVHNIIKQNKKDALLEFLFGKGEDNKLVVQGLTPEMDHKIQNLQNQVNFLAQQVERLQQKVIQLEAKFMPFEQNTKYALSDALAAPDARKIIQQKDKGLDNPNFITLGKILEQEKIEIIQIGFQRQAEGKISLKKYYESTDSDSLFQYNLYNIKYQTIRKTTLYQNLKE